MSSDNLVTLSHSNRYSADSACEHCEGVVRHEAWCITVSSIVLYAYQAALDANKLSMGDQLILHALGVVWRDNPEGGLISSSGVTFIAD
jgi:hypothetical protein